MNFRTTLQIPKRQCMSYADRYLLMGSCFAENMGKHFERLGFSALQNPFGIIYNPASIAQGLEQLLEHKAVRLEDLFEHNGLWHSWLFHGSYSHVDAQEALSSMNRSIDEGSKQLLECNHLILTMGSSWVYSYHGTVVANCHKVPQRSFQERRLEISEIVSCYKALFARLFQLNPKLQITLSVSPVRYLGQGILAAQTNKAVLLLACEELSTTFEQVHYFPAYEIILDDLRDYRFYTDDMIHPSAQAVAYVWQEFSESCFTKESLKLMPQVEKLKRSLEHRPLHGEHADYIKFRTDLEKKIHTLKEKYPYICL